MTEEHAGPIRVTSDGAVRVVTLHRPDQLNAFDREMHEELPRALDRIASDRDARCVVITGAGRAFSAGGDLDGFEALRTDLEHRRQSLRGGRRLLEAILDFHLPTVAAVNGAAVGLGCTLATACDIVVMAESAFLADPHVSVALVAGDGGAVTWPLLTSLLRAKQYLFTGDRIPAAEAVAIGMANFAVPDAELMQRAVAFAHRVAAQPAQAVQDTKAVLNQHLRQSALLTLQYGLAAESQSHDTEDFRVAPERLRARRDAR